MIRRQAFAGLLALTASSLPASAQRAPMSWETFDYTRPFYLTPWALVCRTIDQAEVAGRREDEKGPGCMKPPQGARIQVTWLRRGDGENERYQLVRGRMRGREFTGWTLGVDLINE